MMSRSQPHPIHHSPAPEHAHSKGWRPLFAFFLSTLGISLVLSLFATPCFGLSWWKTFRRCVSIGAGVSLWLLIRKREKRSLRSYGFFDRRAGRRQFTFGVLLGLGGLGLLFILGVVSGTCRIHITPDQWRLWRTVIGFAPAAVLVGVLEELVFRGYILQHLLSRSRILAVLLSSALYAAVHVKGLAVTASAGLELVGLFLLGIVLCLSYLLTHQLYLAVGLHAVLAYGARVNKLLVELPNASVAWFVGTSRIINGMASWILLLGMAGAIIWWTRAQRGVAYEKS